VSFDIEKRSAYANAVLAAGERWRKASEEANRECRDEMKASSEKLRLRNEQAMRVYDEEVKAAAIEYRKEVSWPKRQSATSAK